MDCITIRVVFERRVVEELAEEYEFRDNADIAAVCTVKPLSDHFLAVFVVKTEPADDHCLSLTVLSTTVVGVQRYTTSRLRYQGVHLLTAPRADGLLVNLLRAHFRAAGTRTQRALEQMYSGLPPRWRVWYQNGAGDLDTPFEWLIEDPDVAELEGLWSLVDPRPDSEDL
jgi:hypothetical protein